MRRALIVIDVQESFRQDPGWETISNPGIVGPVKRLVDAARANGDLVIWVLHAEAGSDTVFDPASGYVRLIDGLAVQDGEPVITKTSHNAFTTTGLAQLLTSRGIAELASRTPGCCAGCARPPQEQVIPPFGLYRDRYTSSTEAPYSLWTPGVMRRNVPLISSEPE